MQSSIGWCQERLYAIKTSTQRVKLPAAAQQDERLLQGVGIGAARLRSGSVVLDRPCRQVAIQHDERLNDR